MTTKNIPDTLPILVDPTSEAEIKDWMRSRPHAPEIDGSINERSRWEYTIVDEHIWSSIKVRDRVDGTEFQVLPDIDNF